MLIGLLAQLIYRAWFCKVRASSTIAIPERSLLGSFRVQTKKRLIQIIPQLQGYRAVLGLMECSSRAGVGDVVVCGRNLQEGLNGVQHWSDFKC